MLAAVFNARRLRHDANLQAGQQLRGGQQAFTVRHDATKRAGTAAGGSAWHADRVLDFLAAREAAGDTDPFLIYFGFSHPHDTRDGTPELLAKYGATNHTDAVAALRRSTPGSRRCRPPGSRSIPSTTPT